MVRFVLYIDDLDRCTDGKSVQVLEAVQLLFNETVPAAGGLLAEDLGWVVLWAKATVSWRRFKDRIGRFLNWICCRGHCFGATPWSVKDARNTIKLCCCGLCSRPTTSEMVRRQRRRDREDGDLESGANTNADDAEEDMGSSMWDKAPFITVFVSWHGVGLHVLGIAVSVETLVLTVASRRL